MVHRWERTIICWNIVLLSIFHRWVTWLNEAYFSWQPQNQLLKLSKIKNELISDHICEYFSPKFGVFLLVQILSCLSVQGGSGSNSFTGDSSEKVNISRANIKERFKTFNVQFEELHQRQSQWTVPDSELRESLRLAVAEVLLPAYRSFMKRFGYYFFKWYLNSITCLKLIKLHSIW